MVAVCPGGLTREFQALQSEIVVSIADELDFGKWHSYPHVSHSVTLKYEKTLKKVILKEFD